LLDTLLKDHWLGMQTQKYALVTGGNRGIGLEVCRKLVQHGKPVLLTARSAEAAQRAAQQLRGSTSVDVQAFALEAGDANSISQLVKNLGQYDQKIELLVRIGMAIGG
jgi:short-subunit dehydrogenase